MAKFFNNIKEVTDMYTMPLVLEVALESDFRRGQIVSRRGTLGKTGNLFLVVSGQWKAEICGEERMMNPGDLFYALFRDGYRAECLSEYGKVRIIGFHGPLAEAILFPILSRAFFRWLMTLKRSGKSLSRRLLPTASRFCVTDLRHFSISFPM